MATVVRATLREAAPLAIIDLQGDLVSSEDAALDAAYQDATHVLLHVGGVAYITCSGIATIIRV